MVHNLLLNAAQAIPEGRVRFSSGRGFAGAENRSGAQDLLKYTDTGTQEGAARLSGARGGGTPPLSRVEDGSKGAVGGAPAQGSPQRAWC